MPLAQAAADNAVRIKRAGLTDRERALCVLHCLRTVALHPALDSDATAERWLDASARLSVAIRLLDRIREKGEHALIFL